MLTKSKSKRSVQLRLLLLLPMLGGFIYCCAQNKASIRVDIKDNRVTKKGIILKYMGASSPNTVQIIADTIFVENPATGERQMKVSLTEPQPELLNSQKITGASLLSVPPRCIQLDKAFSLEHIVKQAGIEPLLSNLPDGKYSFSISDLLIDPSGHAVYYRVSMPYKRDGGGMQLSPQQQQLIHEGIAGVLINDDLTFTIEKDKAGKAIPYGFPDDNLLLFMTIKNHQLSYSNQP